jgi:hypothetical protein
MPTKIVPSARFTEIQLSRPPITVAIATPTAMLATTGSPTRSAKIADMKPPTPASAPVQRKSCPVLPKMTLNATA